MKQTLIRLSLVTLLNLALFEFCERISVHWRESSQEELLPLEWLVMAVTLVWACHPAFKKTGDFGFRATGLAALLFPVLYFIVAFYSWNIRPNLGFYQESDWVAQHPGFQRQLRGRIEANLWPWNRAKPAPATSPTVPSPSQ